MERRRESSEDYGRRGSRDEGRDRGGRDSDRGGSSRDEGRSSRRGGDDERGGSRRGGSGYQYQARSAESVAQRASSDSKFDKLLKPGTKMWSPHDGDNRVRIVPPTWEKPGHYGYDIHVHYGVGPDRQSYLDLDKMLGKPDPITEERDKFKRQMNPEDKRDQEYLKELESRQRVLVYIIDRDDEKEGLQAWAMPRSLDMDIVKISQDKDTREVLQIDHPEDGYDITFEKRGKGINTKYEGVAIARRSSPLGKDEWLEEAVENPLPDQLQYFEYDHIAKAFGAGGGHRESDRGGDSDRDRDGGRDRDREGNDRGRDREPSRNDRDRGRDSGRDAEAVTWEEVQDMKPREIEDLIKREGLKIDPAEAKDDQDLADWVCEDMKLTKAEPRSSGRRVVDEPAQDPGDKLRAMRERRRGD